MAKTFNILRNGRRYDNYELLKKCSMNSGYTVFLFRGETTPNVFNYIVCVRKGSETVEFHSLMQHMHPFSMYVDLICCYA